MSLIGYLRVSVRPFRQTAKQPRLENCVKSGLKTLSLAPSNNSPRPLINDIFFFSSSNRRNPLATGDSAHELAAGRVRQLEIGRRTRGQVSAAVQADPESQAGLRPLQWGTDFRVSAGIVVT